VDFGDLGFHQENVDGYIIRTFPNTMDDTQLYWHLDAADRVLTVLEGKNWKIQLDNELPITLVSDTNYFIKKETYHRLLKGTGNLILKIKEI